MTDESTSIHPFPSAERPAGEAPSNEGPVPAPEADVVTHVRDFDIHSFEYGVGGEVLLLLHGLSGSSRWWARNIPELARHHRLLVPDIVGFGRSRASGRLPDLEGVARLLGEWLERRGCDRVTLVGHSMGGQIGIHLAVHQPDRLNRLVLVDSAGLRRPLGGAQLLRIAAEAGPLWRWGDPSFLPVIAGDALTAGPRVLLTSLRQIIRDDVRPLLPRIAVPTLIIWGERDTLMPIRDAWELRQSIPGSRLAILRGAAHNPMIDRPADFNRILLRFLEGETVGR